MTTSIRLQAPSRFKTSSRTPGANQVLRDAGRMLREAGADLERLHHDNSILRDKVSSSEQDLAYVNLSIRMAQSGTIRYQDIPTKTSEMKASKRGVEYWEGILTNNRRGGFSAESMDKSSSAVGPSTSEDLLAQVDSALATYNR